MKNYILWLIVLCLPFVGAAQTTQTAVFFDVNVADLSPEAKKSLDELAMQLAALPDYEWRIEAHTDNTGSAEHNEALAQRRAEMVKQYLMGLGLHAHTGSSVAYGMRKQINKNRTEEEKRLNRRVDVIVTPITIGSFDELATRLLGVYKQTFTILTDVSQTLTANQGTVVKIPAGSLVNELGERVSGAVQVEIIEALNPIEWIALGLTTTSSGALLESGGMMYISASQNGTALQIAEGADVELSLPNVARVNGRDMQLFYRNEADPEINWEPAGTPFESRRDQDLVGLNAASKTELLKNLQIHVPPRPFGPAFAPVTAVMKEPKAPQMPLLPLAPHKEELYKKYHIWKFSSRKKRKRVDGIYKTLVRDYNVKNDRYKKEKARYDKKYKAYLEEEEMYKQSVTNYALYVDTFFQQVVAYKDSMYRHLYYTYLMKAVAKGYDTKADIDSVIVYWEDIAVSCALRELKVEYGFVAPDYEPYMYDFRYSRNFIKAYCKNKMAAAYSKYENKINASLCVADQFRRAYKSYLDLQTGEMVIPNMDEVMTYQPQFTCRRQIVFDSSMVVNAAFNSYYAQSDSANFFVSKFSKLGWINCDRFYDSKSPKAPLEVLAHESASRVFAVFEEINSMMGMYPLSGSNVRSTNPVPVGTPVKVLSLKIENGQAYYASQSLVTSENTFVELPPYEQMSLDQLRKTLKRL
jgi:hypothetical protein